MSVNDNKAIVRKAVEEIWQKHNLSVLEQVYDKRYVYHGAPSTKTELRGPEGYRQMVEMELKAFPDASISADEIVAEGETVVMRWTFRGTHKGDYNGVAPTGRQNANPGVSIFHFASGKIMDEWAMWDERRSYQLLGVAAPL